MDISMSVCGRWRATARYGGPWQGSLPGLAVWGTLHLDGGWTVLEPLGRRDNPPDQRTSPSLPGDRPGAQKRKRGFAGFSAGTTRSLKVAGYTPVALATANGTERNRLVRDQLFPVDSYKTCLRCCRLRRAVVLRSTFLPAACAGGLHQKPELLGRY